MKRFLEVGKIVSTHGIKGEVRVQPWCDDAYFLCQFDTLYIRGGEQQLSVVCARVSKNVAILKFEGIDTIEQANAYRNFVLYMDRTQVTLDPNTFFIQDLIGLSVVDAQNGRNYGTLVDVTKTGANDVYHIQLSDGREVLIPAIKDVVVQTDLEQGIMKISPLKGLFDDED